MTSSQGLIGIDESGKGDYFGPLVVAAVHVPRESYPELASKGVKDSKRVSDTRAKEIAQHIRQSFPHEVIVIGPERYNILYSRMRNLNRILAWAHARALENLLDRVVCDMALSDKFGDVRFIENALMEKGRTITLLQQVRAEEDISVASASLVARAEFLHRLKEISTRWACPLPKGAGPQVEETAQHLVQKFGPEVLSQIAKVHFRTTKRVLDSVRR